MKKRFLFVVALALVPLAVGVRAHASDHCDDTCDREPSLSCGAGKEHQECLDSCYAQNPRYPSAPSATSTGSSPPSLPPPPREPADDAEAEDAGAADQ